VVGFFKLLNSYKLQLSICCKRLVNWSAFNQVLGKKVDRLSPVHWLNVLPRDEELTRDMAYGRQTPTAVPATAYDATLILTLGTLTIKLAYPNCRLTP